MIVSFIIVAYNAQNVIQFSLDCLKNQTYEHKKIEVILVDGKSTDETKKVMLNFKEKYSEEFNRILVLDNPKKILPAGWNVALERAKGEAIIRVDAHSTFPDNFIEENVKELKNGENIVGGQIISKAVDNTQWKKTLLLAEESLFGGSIAGFRRKSEKKYVKTLAHAMYKKEVFDKVGKYNENLARTEDNEMHYRMRKEGYKFLLSPNIISYRFTRDTLKGLIKQKYNNGKWIGITIKYCPKCFSLYHFIPLLFVLGIIFSSILAFAGIPSFIYMLASVYIIFNVVNLLRVIKNNGFNIQYLLLPFIFFLLHICYGIGTIVGLIKSIWIKKQE